MDHRKFMKPMAAAEKIGVGVATMANWRWQQKGPPFYRVGGLILYADDEIDGWISAGREPAADAISQSASEQGSASAPAAKPTRPRGSSRARAPASAAARAPTI
jgi:hypothetical protein